MTAQEKIKVFVQELRQITDKGIGKFAQKAIAVLPDYFFAIPASSTGKYHPKYALGEGGLVRHTKAAFRIAIELFRNETVTGKLSSTTKDRILAAILIHDGLKSGNPKETYTVTNHPIIVCDYIEENVEFGPQDIDAMDRVDIYDLIHSHMGQWNSDRDGKELMPLPATAAQRFVHMVDYLASRKLIEINFDA